MADPTFCVWGYDCYLAGEECPEGDCEDFESILDDDDVKMGG